MAIASGKRCLVKLSPSRRGLACPSGWCTCPTDHGRIPYPNLKRARTTHWRCAWRPTRAHRPASVFVARPNEVYQIEMTVRLPAWPEWAVHCRVEPVTRLSRAPLTVPTYTFTRADASAQDTGPLLT